MKIEPNMVLFFIAVLSFIGTLLGALIGSVIRGQKLINRFDTRIELLEKQLEQLPDFQNTFVTQVEFGGYKDLICKKIENIKELIRDMDQRRERARTEIAKHQQDILAFMNRLSERMK